jgi:hypothetical protein
MRVPGPDLTESATGWASSQPLRCHGISMSRVLWISHESAVCSTVNQHPRPSVHRKEKDHGQGETEQQGVKETTGFDAEGKEGCQEESETRRAFGAVASPLTPSRLVKGGVVSPGLVLGANRHQPAALLDRGHAPRPWNPGEVGDYAARA